MQSVRPECWSRRALSRLLTIFVVVLATPAPGDACTCLPLAPCESWDLTLVVPDVERAYGNRPVDLPDARAHAGTSGSSWTE